jgi:hypothetical protein
MRCLVCLLIPPRVKQQGHSCAAEHPDTLGSMNNLAGTFSMLGRHHAALALQEHVLGKEHPDTMTSMNNLAVTFHDLGRNRDALALLERVQEVSARVLGEEHPDTGERAQPVNSSKESGNLECAVVGVVYKEYCTWMISRAGHCGSRRVPGWLQLVRTHGQ